ncbi:DUF2857 domain-containing protein [Caviibacterium pharyngocola]|uniref:DUF2857 domain-containing protein n=1 Tax=Caviibacterium pharyngocola TaxID=28159 RepID=A0A2M8RSR5_9PAST|nr:DUF2857 domain-containing protein [Caviibacterium pharyngocola]PJG81923.1 hypothetical protein CVP04_11800 [Caviibacterium pharyngocola]
MLHTSLNQAVLSEIFTHLRNGNIKSCQRLGFSEEELNEIQQLSADEVFDIENSHLSFAKISINHEVFWKIIALAKNNTQERRIIARALMLGASIEMLHTYFGLTSSEVSAQRKLLGIEEKEGRKPLANDELQTTIWHLWKQHKTEITDIYTLAGLETLMLIAEETGTDLTVIWKLISQW